MLGGRKKHVNSSFLLEKLSFLVSNDKLSSVPRFYDSPPNSAAPNSAFDSQMQGFLPQNPIMNLSSEFWHTLCFRNDR